MFRHKVSWKTFMSALDIMIDANNSNVARIAVLEQEINELRTAMNLPEKTFPSNTEPRTLTQEEKERLAMLLRR